VLDNTGDGDATNVSFQDISTGVQLESGLMFVTGSYKRTMSLDPTVTQAQLASAAGVPIGTIPAAPAQDLCND